METKLAQTKKEVEVESALLNIAQRMKVSPHKLYSEFYTNLPQDQKKRFKNPRQYSMFLKTGKIHPLYKTLSNTDFVRNKKLVKKFGKNGDWDKDGIPNWKDCKPFNYQEQGLFSSIGKTVSKAVSKAVSSVKSAAKSVASGVSKADSNVASKVSSTVSGGNKSSNSGDSSGGNKSSRGSSNSGSSNVSSLLNQSNANNENSQKGGVFNKDTMTYTDASGNPMSTTLENAQKMGATITENAKINRSGGVTLSGVTYIGNAVVPNTGGKTANQLQAELRNQYYKETGKHIGGGRLSGTFEVLDDSQIKNYSINNQTYTDPKTGAKSSMSIQNAYSLQEQPLYNAISYNNYGNRKTNSYSFDNSSDYNNSGISNAEEKKNFYQKAKEYIDLKGNW